MARRFWIIPILLLFVGCRFLGGDAGGKKADCCPRGFSVAGIKLESAFTRVTDGRVEAFVTLLDEFGEPLKSLGQFRFEFFQYKKSAAELRGVRYEGDGLQNVDLSELAENQGHYDCVTRSYMVDLKLPEQADGEVILEATFTLPGGLRFSDFMVLKTK